MVGRCLACALLLTALAAPLASGAKSSSGITGDVRLGPTCPVQRSGNPSCADKPYSATIEIRRHGRLVARVHAGKNGRFRVSLAPATYRLVPLSPRHARVPRAAPVKVSVGRGFVHVSIVYDSGLR